VSAQRDDRLDDLLRSCIECGLCLPHCATYLASGNEALSPRGRLLLLRHVRTAPLAPAVRESFDLCLGCQACVAACPSGIAAEVLEYLPRLAAPRAGWAGPVPVSALERSSVLAMVRRAAVAARSLARAFAGAAWRRRLEVGPLPLRRLARLLGSLPTSPDDDGDLRRQLDALCAGRRIPGPVSIASGPTGTGPVVAIFSGCADRALLPGTARRLRALLVAAGCRLHDVPHQDCCGALAAHTGRPRRAQRLRARNQAAFVPHLAACDHVVVAAAGCGQELSSYPHALASKALDAAVLLARLTLPPLQPVPLRVAVHDPCHARHTRGIFTEPRALLAQIPGLEVVEPAEGEVCCGGAGAYALRHAELAAAMGRRKAEMLVATGCDLVVTTNPGCLGQIADALAMVAPGVPVLPLTDLLWYAWRPTSAP